MAKDNSSSSPKTGDPNKGNSKPNRDHVVRPVTKPDNNPKK